VAQKIASSEYRPIALRIYTIVHTAGQI